MLWQSRKTKLLTSALILSHALVMKEKRFFEVEYSSANMHFTNVLKHIYIYIFYTSMIMMIEYYIKSV